MSKSLELALGPALRSPPDQQGRDDREDDRDEEDAPPVEAGSQEAAEECGEAGASPGPDGPHRDRTLPALVVPVGLHERHRRRHDACCRKPLNGPSRQQQRYGEVAPSEDEQHRPDDVEGVAEEGDPHTADPVCDPAEEDDEQSGEQRRDRDREVHLVEADVRIRHLVDRAAVDVGTTDVDRRVGRRIVGDDQLEVLIRLAEQRLDRLREIFSPL